MTDKLIEIAQKGFDNGFLAALVFFDGKEADGSFRTDKNVLSQLKERRKNLISFDDWTPSERILIKNLLDEIIESLEKDVEMFRNTVLKNNS